MKSHYVSKVLLKQFMIDGEISVKDIDTKEWKQVRDLREIAYIEVPASFFQVKENYWGSKYEGRVSHAFKLVENHTIFEHPEHVEHLIRFLVLHLVRSLYTYKLYEDLASDELPKFVNDMKLFGYSQKKSRNDFTYSIKKFTPKMIDRIVKNIHNQFLQHGIEIAEISSNRNFIIADNPVITQSTIEKYSSNKIDSANTFFMPIHPKFGIALADKKRRDSFYVLSDKEIRRINRLSRRNAIDEFYCSPR